LLNDELLHQLDFFLIAEELDHSEKISLCEMTSPTGVVLCEDLFLFSEPHELLILAVVELSREQFESVKG